MLAKLWNLLEPLKNLKSKATVLRLGLAGVVLGVGGFAVYKGVQQMKPGRPAPKRTATAANALRQPDPANSQGDPSESPVRMVSGQTPDDNPSADNPSADSLYEAGAGQGSQAGENGSLYRVDDRDAVSRSPSPGEEDVPPSPLQQYSGGYSRQQPDEDGAVGDTGVPVNRIRDGAPAPIVTGTSPHEIADDSTRQESEGEGAATETIGQYEEELSGGGGVYGSSGDGAARESLSSGRRSRGASADPAAVDSSDASRTAIAPQTLPLDSSRGGNLPSRIEPAEENFPTSAGGGLSVMEGPVSGAGSPGERQIEGTQVPAVAIEKFAPAEIQVGKSATFEIRVRNAGQVPAHDVIVIDQVPRGTKLESTNPAAEMASDDSLAWTIGDIQPGDEIVLSMQVMPEQEGEIGSVAQVKFSGRATARSVCTRPLLAIEHTAPKQALIGDTVRMSITVHNPGTGAATGVIVEEDVPEGLTHVAGSELEYEIGTLRPGETRQLELQLTADKAGLIENLVTVRGEGNLIAQHKVQIEVIAPQLAVAVNGPKMRYLERQATYTLSIENPGTAAARSVQLVAYLPKGMKFFSTDAEGQYDPTQHAVFWSLEELPASKSGSVKLVAVPVETGEQRLRVEGKADLGLSASQEQVVKVEAKSELVFDIVDVNDPIEVGTDTIYEIRVSNSGTRPATNVEVAAGFPEAGELRPVSADGQSRGEVNGQQVTFQPVGRINPGEEVIFRIHAQGTVKGDHVMAVQIRSAEFTTPVTREESTRVYEDR